MSLIFKILSSSSLGIEIPLRESLGKREIKNTNKTSLTIILKMLIEKYGKQAYTEIIRLQGLTEILNIFIKDFYALTRFSNYNQWNS